MSTFAAMGVYVRTDDWLIVGLSLCVAYLVLYPSYVFLLRRRRSQRIKNQLVTSYYKMPVKLTPVELAYVFSTKVSKQQLYATLLDLTNRSVLVLKVSEGKKMVSIGPKVDHSLNLYEKMLLSYINGSDRAISISNILDGNSVFGLSSGEKIKGSRQYVFWWLLRQSMRERNLIENHMTGRYSRLLLKFAVLYGLFVSVVPVVLIRLARMLRGGEVDIDLLMKSLVSGLLFWAMAVIPLLLISFFLLRFRGKMLGRHWLMTNSFHRYLEQLEGYREFVRLVHKGKLRFDSKNMEKESKAETRPYAIALGYVKE